MPRIFISYRRDDSRKDASRIYDRLVTKFRRQNVFKDVDNIPLGRDFRVVLSEAVKGCDVVLAVIGSNWLNIEDEHGNRRLDNPADFVRIEIQTALERGDDNCLVIPLLVDHATMPLENDLPPELRELAFKNALIVRDDPDFHRDMERLIKQLRQYDTELQPRSEHEKMQLEITSNEQNYKKDYLSSDDKEPSNDPEGLVQNTVEGTKAPQSETIVNLEDELEKRLTEFERSTVYSGSTFLNKTFPNRLIAKLPKIHTKQINSIAFSPDSILMASCSGGEIIAGDTNIRFWDVAKREFLYSFEGHTEATRSIAFSSDGKLLASGSWDHTVRLWSVSLHRQLAVLKGHTRFC